MALDRGNTLPTATTWPVPLSSDAKTAFSLIGLPFFLIKTLIRTSAWAMTNPAHPVLGSLFAPVPSQGSSSDSHAFRLQCSLLPKMMNKTTEHLAPGRWCRKGAPGHQNFPTFMPHRWFIYLWTFRSGRQIPPTRKTPLRHFQSFVDNLSHPGLRLVPFWKDQSKAWDWTRLK